MGETVPRSEVASSNDKAGTSGALGICLSGGGVRATFFAFGILLFFSKSRLNERVRIVSSVSGGSIANLVAALTGDFAQTSYAELVERVRRASGYLASEGVFFLPQRPVVISFFFVAVATAVSGVVSAAAPLEYNTRLGILSLVAYGLITFILALVVASLLLFSLRSYRQREQYCALISRTFGDEPDFPRPSLLDRLVYQARLSLPSIIPVAASVGNAVLKPPTQLMASVSRVSAWAQSRWLTAEAHLSRPIVCATDLASGRAFYMMPGGISSPVYGSQSCKEPALLDAVYASAAFPGVFSPLRIRSDRVGVRHGFDGEVSPWTVVLADGGVYNNLGSEALELTPEPLMGAFIVNAGAPMRHVRMSNAPLWRNLRDLLRINSVMYNSTIGSRLVSIGAGEASQGFVVLDLTTTASELCGKLHDQSLDNGVRARAKALLDAVPSGELGLRELTPPESRMSGLFAVGRRLGVRVNVGKAPSSVPTTLWPIGPASATRLIRMGYAHAAVASRVLLGYEQDSDPGTFAREISAEDFEQLVPRASNERTKISRLSIAGLTVEILRRI